MSKNDIFCHFSWSEGGMAKNLKKPWKNVKKWHFYWFFGFRMFVHNNQGFSDGGGRAGRPYLGDLLFWSFGHVGQYIVNYFMSGQSLAVACASVNISHIAIPPPFFFLPSSFIMFLGIFEYLIFKINLWINLTNIKLINKLIYFINSFVLM